MKTLILIRHAKSDWGNPGLRDFDRPLNERGERDAPFMAKQLVLMGYSADALVSSPANRAFTTATYFAEAMEIDDDDIIQRQDIYEAMPSVIQDEIFALDDQYKTVCMFGHNPTFTMVANDFGPGYIANIPTCGIVVIQCAAESWAEFIPSQAKVSAFYYPKQYFEE